ncbi:MAG: ankyrin repeat domain-containing protein [Rubrivivax sp.]
MTWFLKTTVQALVASALSLACVAAVATPSDDFFNAVNRGDGRSVGRLVDAGVDPNLVDGKGQTALILALRDDSPQVVDALLAQPKLRVDAANANGETALMMAALKGRLEAMQALIQRGAPINRTGWSPLHYAASGSEPKAVSLLLDRGADIEALSPNRSTPLMMASRYGAMDSADLLLARGASLKARNDADMTAIDFARTAGRDRLVARMEQLAR